MPTRVLLCFRREFSDVFCPDLFAFLNSKNSLSGFSYPFTRCRAANRRTSPTEHHFQARNSGSLKLARSMSVSLPVNSTSQKVCFCPLHFPTAYVGGDCHSYSCVAFNFLSDPRCLFFIPSSSRSSRRTFSRGVYRGSAPPWGNCQCPFSPQRSPRKSFPFWLYTNMHTFGRKGSCLKAITPAGVSYS